MRSRLAIRRLLALRTQAAAALVAVIFLAGNLASYVHVATERHVHCPEHGEVIHPIEETPVADAARDRAPGLAVTDAPGDASTHEHEHCYMCPTSRERASLAAAAGSSWLALDTIAPPRHALVVEPAIEHLYILAPKTSPPV